MLLDFIRGNRTELIRRTREKVGNRSAPRATPDELESGVPLFLTQFIELLAATNNAAGPARGPSSAGGNVEARTTPFGSSATQHGNDLLRRGFTIAQVVHDYGDICQAATELAGDVDAKFSAQDFHLLNLCLDNAIAEAVTEYSRQREQNLAEEEVERLGFLAHEMRNLTSTATMAFQFIRAGSVAIGGSTGAVLERSLTGLRELVDRSLAEVRLASGQHKRSRVVLAEFIEEIEVSASLDAKASDIDLTVAPVEYAIAIDADRQLLASAVSNLLQNAFKFTRAHSAHSKRRGHVALRTRRKADHVLIEVEDECGGLPAGKAEELFRPFERRGADNSGLGLGLAISRKSVGVNGGVIHVENKPGHGCVFTIELPVVL